MWVRIEKEPIRDFSLCSHVIVFRNRGRGGGGGAAAAAAANLGKPHPEDLNASNTVERENLNKEGLIDEEKKEKDLLRHLITSLGSPCDKVMRQRTSLT